ncbi:hypothetical protein L596_026759 [Steinernema carpocapsae]|uniref:Uncharacterized protein n=1 Tax=Steinernema carpocapsae TaxID=34508 RepID=A0A4U5M2C8_STECR|nr:hypothetical protein L596_026759 [Steinernema carpocapsae]
MFASSLSLICVNICIVVDRVMAMKIPVLYVQKYKQMWLRISIFVAVATFSVATLVYCLGVVDRDVVNIVYAVKTGISVFNIPFTVYFLKVLKKFVKITAQRLPSETLRTANQIVVYQLIADIVVIIIPTIITYILNEILETQVTTVVGSYPNSLYAIYTTSCALLRLLIEETLVVIELDQMSKQTVRCRHGYK